MNIIRIPVLSDNYIFLLHDVNTNQVAVVDPAIPEPVLMEIKNLGADLVAIFNTHHHFDHVGGNQELLKYYPNAVVYGGIKDKGRIPHQQVFLEEGDTVEFGDRKADVYFVPGHTYAHIAYYFPPVEASGWGELFCGDTLFAGGCGRLFEGTPTDMVNSLTKFRNLPDSTRVWCAHEYTLSNLKFAITIDKDNQDLQQRLQQVVGDRQKEIPTIPSSIKIEKLTNPFLRWDNPKIKQAMGLNEPERVFGRLRGMKDNF
ncbi:MAG: hydroxyacylglutathione hydrolase [Cyanobacteria bacterium]|nr:hydroxyacylglutathione hydrolase [Cyanobacteria bacterium CG_2015-16_32_12]NCO79341.1 hydroxyacylglutathione hydrolase [Cyanobacteria bacterium CG_2015-22_32_23]NCQ05073.1 hydroxyacylglutathione hydrolase [Cyanobacteria bacterium CG_2015-09_32_10]NCQ41022.1 hydroxyacylglutathione hydrolase [Cyanobacteria bacterium CG_2015-04_32_10]NCS84733.1 hydroxyacylglutathione hydrolase [Cyanobacteria bacterium CG_2015-02_32_10]